MNIYEYLVSPDIAAHCAGIGHVFSPLDMAVIVALCGRPIKEKHAAWREIIRDYPDMPIHKSMNFEERASLHDFLRGLIAWEEKMMADFYMPGEGIMYCPESFWTSDERWADCGCGCYSTLERALEGAHRFWSLAERGRLLVRIERKYIDVDDWQRHFSAEFNSDGAMLRFHSWCRQHECAQQECAQQECDRICGVCLHDAGPGDLGMIFIHIPLPFTKGDLIDFHGKPYILERWAHNGWARNTREANDLKYKDFVSGKIGDGSDMMAYMFYINKEGRLLSDHDSESGCTFSYCDFKLFTGELKGQDRFLKYLSQYIKNEEEDIDWLMSVFAKFRAEAKSDEAGVFLNGEYGGLDKMEGAYQDWLDENECAKLSARGFH